jgi:hypothetical protein
MGFRVARKATRLCPIVVARLTASGIKNLKERLDGADAVIAPADAIEDIKGLDVIWGARLDGGTADEVSKAGGDFVVFKAEETGLGLLEDEKIGKVILADVSAEGSLLRAISGIPVDAALAVGESVGGGSLNWQQLLSYQRLSDFIKQPLLAPVPFKVSEKVLQALWGSGVVGLVVELDGSEEAGSLKKLRQLVDDTDFATAKKEKGSAMLPRLSAEPQKSEEAPSEIPEVDPEEDE